MTKTRRTRYADATGNGDPFETVGRRFRKNDEAVGEVFKEYTNASQVAEDQANPRKRRKNQAEVARLKA